MPRPDRRSADQREHLAAQRCSSFAESALLNEGISCAVCHQWDGKPETASGGLSRFQDGLRPGHVYFGALNDAVGNAFHHSEATATFKQPEQLCRNCHSVQYDKNGDGQLHRGSDLVLQTLFDEWEDYRKAGGSADCVSCHMPLVKDTRAAEHAALYFEQDKDAPARKLHDHSFVGADYPLDDRVSRELLRPAREALLRSGCQPDPAAQFAESSAERARLHVAGEQHRNRPQPARRLRLRPQMWLEITVLDSAGRALAGSACSPPRAMTCATARSSTILRIRCARACRDVRERSAARQFPADADRRHSAQARQRKAKRSWTAAASRCSNAARPAKRARSKR